MTPFCIWLFDLHVFCFACAPSGPTMEAYLGLARLQEFCSRWGRPCAEKKYSLIPMFIISSFMSKISLQPCATLPIPSHPIRKIECWPSDRSSVVHACADVASSIGLFFLLLDGVHSFLFLLGESFARAFEVKMRRCAFQAFHPLEDTASTLAHWYSWKKRNQDKKKTYNLC